MPKSTPATLVLRKLGIAFKLHTYVYDSTAEHIGLQAAEALDVEPGRVLKTLMAEVDGRPVFVFAYDGNTQPGSGLNYSGPATATQTPVDTLAPGAFGGLSVQF